MMNIKTSPMKNLDLSIVDYMQNLNSQGINPHSFDRSIIKTQEENN